ncbi:hypothetical protein O2K51_11060 [Apibacter raozihei]|uniref:hypothetical protein n=1 Tax=Apibacter raozihei TaxID=2500547 RepID=UPI000FE30F68|nr:hypothetical protein [Apibacter raozihei]
MFSQIYQCPISDGKVIKGYRNDKETQLYKGLFFKDNLSPIGVTIIADRGSKDVKSFVQGTVLYVDDSTNCLAIIYDNINLISYESIKNITVIKGDSVKVGTILGKPMLNTFPPRKYQDFIGVKTELYNVNMTFYYFDKEKQTLVHDPVPLESMGCNIIVCDNCQPKIYGM